MRLGGSLINHDLQGIRCSITCLLTRSSQKSAWSSSFMRYHEC